MRANHPWILRGLCLAILAVVVPACNHDEDDDDGPPPSQNPPPNPPPPPPNKVTVFEDGFDNGLGQWTTPVATGNGPTHAHDVVAGNPAPSLTMTTSAGPDPMTASGPFFLLMDSTTTLSGGPLTISVDMMVPAAGEGSGSIAILDGTNTPVAAAEWHPTTSFGAITFMLAGSAPANTGVPPPPAGTYHKLTFSVDGAGNASWSLDGGGSVLTNTGFPPGPYKIRLYLMVASQNGPFATFHFDNVLATTP